MDETTKMTLAEAQLHFAKTLNSEVWNLLQKSQRTSADNELMLETAYASAYHWRYAGTGVHHQRAEWLIAHVYIELGQAEPALRHAARCFELTAEFASLMQDFDRAYASEIVARANALAGKREIALDYYQRAAQAGEAISNIEDKSIFMGDFNSGNWYGIK
jgi:endonuclease/exonuclease/phosphatase (EEP) superfamily protein YafD